MSWITSIFIKLMSPRDLVGENSGEFLRHINVGYQRTHSFRTQLFTFNYFVLRIEVHFFCLHWEMKGHWSRVNLVKREALLKDLHGTSVLSFPNANKKSVFQSLYLY